MSSITATRTDKTSPAALAKQDIATAADKAYEENVVGSRIYGGIMSHTVLGPKSVAVAGRAGYLVRWRVVTARAPAATSSRWSSPRRVGTDAMVIVRFAFDASPEAPPLARHGQDRHGHPARSATRRRGGVGSSIGPG